MATVRKLTESGIAQFRGYLERLSGGAVEPPPMHLLEDQEHSESLRGYAEVENIVFVSKQAAAEYLSARLNGLERSEVDHDIGLWSWLSWFYFDQV